MKKMLLGMLQDGTAGAVNDTFRHPGRARGIENIKRVRERESRERELLRREGREEILIGDGMGDVLRHDSVAAIADENDALE